MSEWFKIKFNNRNFKIRIRPNGERYDLDIETKKYLSGDDFQKLKQYLENEGYIDAAKAPYIDE
jgi:hypothetical protein